MMNNIYDRFPSWLGIDSLGELVAAILVFICLLIIYFCIGGSLCPRKIKKHWIRAIIISMWPIYIIFLILLLPFVILYDFSKTPEETEKELKELVNEEKRRYEDNN